MFYIFFNLKDAKKYIPCHPEGILAVVGKAATSNCKDSYRMTTDKIITLRLRG